MQPVSCACFRWIDVLTGQTGFRRAVVMIVLGLLAALAFAPFHALPVLWFSYPLLVLTLRRATCLKDAFWIGWSFAFGLFVVGTHWASAALFVDIKTFWWVLPFSVGGLPAFFGVYFGLASMIVWRRGMTRARGVWFFALCWSLADIARGYLFTGFPWDQLGYAWADYLPTLQCVSVIGIEGLTVLTTLLAMAPALLVYQERRRAALASGAALILIFVGLTAWGQNRLAEAHAAFVPDVRLRLVQSDQNQVTKWKTDQRRVNLQRLLDTTFAAPGEKPVTAYVWPETATSYYLTEEPLIRSQIAARMAPGSLLLTGAIRREIGSANETNYYNSLIVMDSKGNVTAGYDKHHLVPFGEYMPFRDVVPLRVINILGTGFTAGPGPRTLRAHGLPPFSALVCYEAIFSGEVAERSDSPRFMVNVTNDAWYTGTIGPAQHFEMSRVRAVEEGIPLVRVATKGVTGIVDPWGRVTAKVEGADSGYVDADLPEALETKNIFAQQGDNIWAGLIFLIFLFSFLV